MRVHYSVRPHGPGYYACSPTKAGASLFLDFYAAAPKWVGHSCDATNEQESVMFTIQKYVVIYK